MDNQPTRRHFLQAGGLGTVGLALADASRTLAAPRRDIDARRGVELAIATICIDGFGDEYFEPAFELIPQTGIRNVEFNVWHPRTVTPTGIESIRRRCYRTGLTPISLQGTSFGGDVLKDVTHKLWLMDRARELGCRRVKFTGAGRGDSGGLERVIAVARELAPAAEEMDVLLLLENHLGNNIETIEDYEKIFAAVDSSHVGMCLDTGHFAASGIDNAEVIDRFHERVLHFDLKDVAAVGSYDKVNFGQGVIEFDRLVPQLLEYGYSGYLVIEQAPPLRPDHLLADMRRAREVFTRYER